MAFLEVNNLNKYYPITDSERFHALKDVQLSFEKGELVSIIGESGSGKSTLMNLLGGLDSQFDGEILVDGENIGKFKEKEMVAFHKEKIGFIFQSFNIKERVIHHKCTGFSNYFMKKPLGKRTCIQNIDAH